MIRAAGVLICSTEGRVLLLQRSEQGDLPGTWCIPGGKLESGEDCLEAAVRETVEETGYRPPKTRCEKWAQRIACDNGIDPVDFTTYCIRDVKEFTPTLNPEHNAFSWVDPAHPPIGIHPGCLVALQKLSPTWNELHVAKAIRDGQLVSPQRYENLTFFDVRVTGTGEAYRSMKRDENGNVLYEEEYVWRDPSLYLNEEFLERCNGVPLILEHPDTSTLTTEEYRTRTIGALTLPYIKGEDVWAIGRVQDDAAARIMSEQQLSTSPAVSWSDPDVNVAGKLRDGSNFLIEGKPTLLDHLAVCWQGVWDKDGGPTGINIVREDSMAISEADLQKLLEQNATISKSLEGINTGFTTLNKRMDSVEKARDTDRREAAQLRIDSFKFSKRVAGETNRAYNSRHDDEERMLRSDLMRVSTGEDAKDKADAAARKARRDAEEKEEEEERRDAASKKDDDDKRKDDDDDKRKDDDDRKDMSAKDEFPPKKEAKDDDDDKRKDDDDDKRKDDDDDKRKDAESKKDDDGKRKDDDDDRKDDRKDARTDSVESLKRQIDVLTGKMKPMSDEDLVKVGKLSKRCDSIYTALGESMPRLMPGENLIDYHRKLAADLKRHTKYKDSELAIIAADSNTFDLVTEEIFRQAEDFAKSPARYKPGEMVQRVERMDSGHTRYTYEGSPTWMRQFAGPVQNHCKKFLVKEDK